MALPEYNDINLLRAHKALSLTKTRVVQDNVHKAKHWWHTTVFLFFVCVFCMFMEAIHPLCWATMHPIPVLSWCCEQVALHLFSRPKISTPLGGPAIYGDQQEQESHFTGETQLLSDYARTPLKEVSRERKFLNMKWYSAPEYNWELSLTKLLEYLLFECDLINCPFML